MATKDLRQLTANLRRQLAAVKAFDIAAHLAATRGPKLGKGDKRQAVIIAGPKGSLL